MPIAPHNITVDVKISGFAYGGSTIGTVSAETAVHGNKKVFIRGAVPGEIVQARITKDKGQFAHAELVTVKEPSPHRRAPPCRYFGSCGGCDYQYIEIDAQRALKRELVESTLARQFRITPLKGVALCSEALPAYGYRRKITLHLNKKGELGFFKAGSETIIPITRCVIASDVINAFLPQLIHHSKELSTCCSEITLEESEGTLQVVVRPRKDRAPNKTALTALQQKIPELKFEQEVQQHAGEAALEAKWATEFSQVNSAGNSVLLSLVTELCAQDTTITEFYAGGGNFTLPLARAGAYITAIESSAALVQLGALRAKSAGVEDRVHFIESTTEDYVQRHPIRGAVVLDPPRAGAKLLCSSLRPEHTRHVVYISCNVPSLGRDLAALAQHGYSVEQTTVIDMFPQTHHVETITELKSK